MHFLDRRTIVDMALQLRREPVTGQPLLEVTLHASGTLGVEDRELLVAFLASDAVAAWRASSRSCRSRTPSACSSRA